MLSLGILTVVGLAYWFGAFGLAFFILCYSILNGGLAATYSMVNPNWYWRKRAMAGLGPFDAGGGVASLVVTKLLILAIEVPLAWHVGKLAGYI